MGYTLADFGKTEIAIIGIVILESIALLNGIDGAMLMTAMATIAGLGGYALKETQSRLL